MAGCLVTFFYSKSHIRQSMRPRGWILSLCPRVKIALRRFNLCPSFLPSFLPPDVVLVNFAPLVVPSSSFDLIPSSSPLPRSPFLTLEEASTTTTDGVQFTHWGRRRRRRSLFLPSSLLPRGDSDARRESEALI